MMLFLFMPGIIRKNVKTGKFKPANSAGFLMKLFGQYNLGV